MKKLPASLEEAVMEMSAGQTLVIKCLSPDQAKSYRRGVQNFIYEKQAEGLIGLDFDVKVHKHPDGAASVTITAFPPVEVSLYETEGDELKEVKKFTIIGGSK